MLNVWLFVAAVVLVVVLGLKTKQNMGILAFIAAFILGYWRLGMRVSAVLTSSFPVAIFFDFVIVGIFFGFATANGTIQLLARKLMYKFRNAMWMGPIVIFLVTAVVSLCGPGGTTALITSGLSFGVAMAMGMHPALCSITVWCAMAGTMCFPFVTPGTINVGTCVSFGIDIDTATKAGYVSGISMLIFCVIEFLVLCVIYKGFKVNPQAAASIQEKPDPFNREQSITMKTIIVCLAGAVIPSLIQMIAPNPVTQYLAGLLSIELLWSLGTVVLVACNCADFAEVMGKRVGWSSIVLIVGMGTLFGLSTKMGVVDALSNALNNVSPWLIVPMLAFFSGIMSFFVNGAVVGAMFIPLATALAGVSGASIPVIVTCITAGGGASCVSPISSGGSAALTGAPDEDARAKCFKSQFALGVINMFLFAGWMVIMNMVF